MNIRRAQKADIPSILAIEQASFSHPLSLAQLENELQLSHSHFFVIESLSCVITAYVIAWMLIDELEIQDLAVHPNYRQQGIAKKLLNHVFLWAREQQIKNVFLEVRHTQQAAQQCYLSLGFKCIGIRKNYYSLPTEDAMVMKLELSLHNFK